MYLNMFVRMKTVFKIFLDAFSKVGKSQLAETIACHSETPREVAIFGSSWLNLCSDDWRCVCVIFAVFIFIFDLSSRPFAVGIR